MPGDGHRQNAWDRVSERELFFQYSGKYCDVVQTLGPELKTLDASTFCILEHSLWDP